VLNWNIAPSRLHNAHLPVICVNINVTL